MENSNKPILEEVFFVIPMVPVSVNHYKHRRRSGHYYVNQEAIDFKLAMWACCREKMPAAKSYGIDITIYLGKGQKLDIDNGNKLILDGLKDAGVIKTDAAFKDMFVHLRRDRKKPRTELRLKVSAISD